MEPSKTSGGHQDTDATRHRDQNHSAITRHSSADSSSHRTFSSLSLSSSCSSNSIGFLDDGGPLSPATPLGLLGVPFSWEQLPGIPKDLHTYQRQKSPKLLPLPPLLNPPSSQEPVKNPRKKGNNNVVSQSFKADPFLAALVRCSKDQQDDEEGSDYDYDRDGDRGSSKALSRSINDRFGFVNLYVSCKRTCAVSDSIVYLPRSARAPYDLVRRRSR